MDKNALKKFALDFSPYETFIQELNHPPLKLFDEDILNQADTNNLVKRAKANPKSHIWFGGYTFLSSLRDIYASNEYIHYDRALHSTGQYEEDDRNDPDLTLENGED